MFDLQYLESEFDILKSRARLGVSTGPEAAESQHGRELIGEVLRKGGELVEIDRLEFPNPKYSLSHCSGVCLAAFDPHSLGIGVDIEKRRSIDLRVVDFFLSSKERLKFGPSLRSMSLVQRLWTIKEAVFKADQKNLGRAYRHYEIVDFSPGFFSGIVRSSYDQLEFIFESKNWREFLVTVACIKGVE